MKTREEMIAAIKEIMKEAETSGFPFCAAINAEGMASFYSSEDQLTTLGLAEVMCDLLRQNLKKP